MVTGRLPFSGANATALLLEILQAQPEAMARFNYDTPPELERIVRKCLEKDRDRRYQSARDLLDGSAQSAAQLSPAGLRRKKPPPCALVPRRSAP